MSDLDEIRQSFPQLNHIPDYDLAEMIHEEHFPNIPKNEYYKNIGLDVPGVSMTQPEDYQGAGEATLRAAGRLPENVLGAVGAVAKGVPSAIIHPIESGKAFVAEGLRGANTLAQNAPNNIVEYMREGIKRNAKKKNEGFENQLVNAIRKKMGLEATELEAELPDWISGDWASPETKDIMNKTVESLAPEYNKELAGTKLTGTVGRYAPAVAALGPLGGVVAQDIAENRNPIQGAMTVKALQNIKPITGKAVELAGKGLEKIPGGEAVVGAAKGAGKIIAQPFKDIARAKDLEKSLIEMEKQKHQQGKSLEAKKESIAGKTAQKIANDTKEIETESTNLQKYAPKTEAESRAALQKILHEKSRELRTEATENFDNVYSEPVGNSTLGKTKLESPLVYSNMQAGYYADALKYLIDSAKAGHELPPGMAQNLYNSATGKTHNANYSPTVKQTVDFAKLVQKEKLRAYEKGRNTNLPEAESRNYENMYKKLSELEKDIWSEVEQNITPKQYSNIREAFKKWGEIVTPFETHPLLESATAKFGKINQANMFEGINKLGQNELAKRLTQDARVNEALAKHDLMGFDAENGAKIKSLLDSDQGRALPVDVQNMLKRQVKNLERLDANTKAGQAITESQIKSILNEPKIKKILKSDPHLLSELADSKTMQKGLRELENKMTEAGIEQKEIKARMGIINKGASLIGLGFVLKALH